MQAATPAMGWQRVAAYLVDYLVIAAYVALLTGASFATGASRRLDLMLSGSPAMGQLVAFLALTLPVMLYFAVSEASQWQGTLGKRALKLRVAAHGEGTVGSLFRRTLLRAALKFAPWELAHTVLWRVEGWPLDCTATHHRPLARLCPFPALGRLVPRVALCRIATYHLRPGGRERRGAVIVKLRPRVPSAPAWLRG